MRIVDRDYVIMKEIERWRFCLSRHIRFLAGFTGQRATDRRLKILIDAGYLERKRILYGVPGLYCLTYKSRVLLGTNLKPDKIKIEQIAHDIAVLDTAIYIHLKEQVSFSDMTTEKQLYQEKGFTRRKHQPDFIFSKEGKTYCVEVELTTKAKNRLETIIKDNFRAYNHQRWVVPNAKISILRILKENKRFYPTVQIIHLEEVLDYVKRYDNSESSPT